MGALISQVLCQQQLVVHVVILWVVLCTSLPAVGVYSSAAKVLALPETFDPSSAGPFDDVSTAP